MLSARHLPRIAIAHPHIRCASRLRPSSKQRQKFNQPSQRSNESARLSQKPEQPQSQSQPQPPGIEDILKNADPSSNSLLAPVHIPEDPNAVLKERHPATSILANSGLVIQRQIEMMNLFLGFEQANRYVVLDAHGNHVGYMAEHDGGIGKSLARQTFRTHRPFTAHIFDRSGREVLRLNRPFSWINSRIRVYDPIEAAAAAAGSSSTALTTSQAGALIPGVDPESTNISKLSLDQMSIIGESQQVWAPLRRKYNLFVFHGTPGQPQAIVSLPVDEKSMSSSQALQVSSQPDGGRLTQFAAVDEPFLSWDFSLLSAEKQLIGSVNRNFGGFGRQIFTDTGVYALRMDSAGLNEEAQAKHVISQSGRNHAIATASPPMTLDQRAVMLSTAVSVDFDYFSRHSGHGGMFPIPIWMGGGAEAAGAGAAGAEATGAVVGGEAAAGAGAGALGRAAGGASGAGEGAMVGAGTMAGYEMMQRGLDGQPQQPPPPGQEAVPPGEEVWGNSDDPWSDKGGSNMGDSGGGGGGGGDGSWLDDLF